MTRKTQSKSNLVRHGRLVARPKNVAEGPKCVTVFTDPLDPERSSVDAVDIYNALLTTHAVKMAGRDPTSSKRFRTAITCGNGITLLVLNSNPSATEFIERIGKSPGQDALLSPMAALMLHGLVRDEVGTGDYPIGAELAEGEDHPTRSMRFGGRNE